MAPLVELEAPASHPSVDLQASTSALETKEDTPFSARDMERQAVVPDQVLGLEAQASAQEAYLELPALGPERLSEATALPP